MVLNDQQLVVLNRILTLAVASCEQHVLATSAEGWLKVQIAEGLLTNRPRLTLLEPRTGKKGMVTAVSLRNNLLHLEDAPRPPRSGSADLRVRDPELALEFKVRARFGSSAQARADGYAKDFRNLVERRADALIMAADVEGYRRLTGEVSRTNAKHFAFLPQSNRLVEAFTDHQASWEDHDMNTRARLCHCHAATQLRVVLATWVGG